MPQPHIAVSILIPNYNNGRESSVTGKRDFIGELFRSLWETLCVDPTGIEIIVADDGSTDDSLETCREWAKKTWRGGSPFCRLMEFEHTGVLSVVANRLAAEARGEILCRLDGDIVIHTPNWAAMLMEIFRSVPPEVGIIGPKQLSPNGFVHSAGDWVLHPRGYHHIGQGITAAAVNRSIEVDHVMGCFYCIRRSVWEEVGPFDETILRGQTVDFGLGARLKGWRCFSVPVIEFTHHHADRRKRENTADTDPGLISSLDRFRMKWGFDRLAPDLDDVARRYQGTPLLWNARVFGPAIPQPAAGTRTMAMTDWAMYGEKPALRDAMDARLRIVHSALQSAPKPGRVLQVSSREGLFCHLLAKHGVECTGVEAEAPLLAVAREMTKNAEYPRSGPAFIGQEDIRALPLDDQSVDLVLLFDVMETHPNPVGLLRESWRVLSNGGSLVVLSSERTSPLDTDVDRMHFYRAHELNALVRNSRLFEIEREAESALEGMLLLVGRRPSMAAAKRRPAKVMERAQ